MPVLRNDEALKKLVLQSRICQLQDLVTFGLSVLSEVNQSLYSKSV